MRHFTAALVFLSLSAAAMAGPCAPLQHFALETDWFGGVTVPVRIGGHDLRLLVDTGGASSMLTATTVATLGMPKQRLHAVRVTMYGGLQITEYVRVDVLHIGGAPAGPTNFYVMPDHVIPYALSGTLAPDFLSRFDVEFDFVGAAMNLYAAGSCNQEPWNERGALAMMPDANHHVIVPVQLDGHTIAAMLDSGASRSDISMETAKMLFGEAMNDARPATSNDAEPGLYTYPFKHLSIGGIEVARPDIMVVPDGISRRPAGTPRLILGMNVLRRLHLFISYSRHLLALQPAE